MGTMASQITSLTIVYSTVYSGADQGNIEAPRHWPLCGEFTGDRWIPRTNGQLRGKCFHLFTSSWCSGFCFILLTYLMIWLIKKMVCCHQASRLMTLFRVDRQQWVNLQYFLPNFEFSIVCGRAGHAFCALVFGSRTGTAKSQYAQNQGCERRATK